jgi:two-component sensor histidine kinase
LTLKENLANHRDSIDHIEKAKYSVSKNLYIFLSIVLGTVGILNLIQNDINYIPLLSGSFLSLICFGILVKFNNYKVAAFIGMFMAFGLTVYNISITSNYGHFVDFFWIVVIAIYLFFVLGNTWGVFNLFLNIAAVTVILYLVRIEIVEQVPKPYTPFSQFNFILNIIISGVVFSYITIKVLTALNKSQKDLLSTNKELIKSNEEKTIMLKEIHHRVKNNLQVITSLLRLQLHEIQDEKSRHHFSDSINRVSAMAIIHEKMYQTESLSKIDIASYLQSLIDDLISSYARLTEIETRITSNIENMEPESIVPLALIFNELVSNTLEHAFQNMPHGVIGIDVLKNENGTTTIHYSDNGKWKAPTKDSSFGLELIETFTEQLDGSCRRESLDSGTHYHFEFSKEL